ncbi:helix-turn-helix transcriptional regulator [Streptomyces sp. NPDC026672]|uniref:helix-turn-helix domain-containing protein n=1 Tax=unclassified Streptomyces TaxID=2593676 RepID=UPI0033D5D718
MSGVYRDSEIGAFLRGQRARLRPEDVNLPPGGPIRRVPGLRRDEVAQLAGVSSDYYARLEQGRNITPSAEVLAAIAGALRLDDAGRTYLFDLVRPRGGAERRRAYSAQRVRGSVQRMMDAWSDQPAVLTGRRTDVLATNALGRALFADFDAMPVRTRNYTRWLFLDEGARALFPDWERISADMAAVLRLDAGRYPDDPRTTELVGELTMRSEHFLRAWTNHRVMEHTHGVKRFLHPVVGELQLEYEGLAVPGDADQTVFVYSAPPGSEAEDALRLLASWTAGTGGGPVDGSTAASPADYTTGSPAPGRAS